jgi:hypothetical protein
VDLSSTAASAAKSGPRARIAGRRTIATTPGDNASRKDWHLPPQQEQADDRPRISLSALRDLPEARSRKRSIRARLTLTSAGGGCVREKVLQVAQPGRHEPQEERRRRKAAPRGMTAGGRPISEPSSGGTSINTPARPAAPTVTAAAKAGIARPRNTLAAIHSTRCRAADAPLEAARAGDQGRIHRSLGTQSPPEHAVLLRVARHARGHDARA